MKKVLIIGASGFVGANLARELRDRYRVYGTYRTHPGRIDGVNFIKVGLEPAAPVQELVALVKPDAVIYCAGYADEKRCVADPIGALFVHAEAPAIVISTLATWRGRFIYLSTSKVFSGEAGHYVEEDAARPRTSYGQAKYHAEDLLSHYDDVFILRLGTAFGLGSTFHSSALINRLLQAFKNGQPIQLIMDEYRNFISCDELARAVATLVECGPHHAGIYHVSNGERDTYFSFAERFAKIFGFSAELLRPVSGAIFSGIVASSEDRGKDLTLSGEKFARTFDYQYASNSEPLTRLKQALMRGGQ